MPLCRVAYFTTRLLNPGRLICKLQSRGLRIGQRGVEIWIAPCVHHIFDKSDDLEPRSTKDHAATDEKAVTCGRRPLRSGSALFHVPRLSLPDRRGGRAHIR